MLDDGAETDLDLGHYERFTHARLDRDCKLHQRKIYLLVINKERNGDFGARPCRSSHVTNEIKDCIRKLATPSMSPEIGVPVDIEAMPYFEAIRQFALDVGKSKCLFIHLTLVPYSGAAARTEDLLTQHSAGWNYARSGFSPISICRTEREIPESDCEKIALFCNVERKAVIEEKDRDFSIYEVPISLSSNKIDELIVEKLNLTEGRATQHDDRCD